MLLQIKSEGLRGVTPRLPALIERNAAKTMEEPSIRRLLCPWSQITSTCLLLAVEHRPSLTPAHLTGHLPCPDALITGVNICSKVLTHPLLMPRTLRSLSQNRANRVLDLHGNSIGVQGKRVGTVSEETYD